MIVYPNAKLNLGLQITGRRADGYHLLSSLFLPIPLYDILEVLPHQQAEDSLTVYGDVSTGALEDNLVLRAVHAMRERYAIPCVDLHLYKHIPSGAGMGGGSADATFTLRALRELFALDIADDELRQIALSLGADCPFFVANEPSLVSGIGEIFAPAPPLELSGMTLVLIKPNLHISTAEAFRGLPPVHEHQYSISEVLSMPTGQWARHLVNDFEASLFPKHPILAKLKQWHYDHGAVYAAMTGSGATLYGLYHEPLGDRDRRELRDLSSCFTWHGTL